MSFVAAGTYVFRLTASDGTNPPVSDTVTLTVVNPPPVVNAGADQTVQLPASASLDGTVTDDGLTLLTTTWSVLTARARSPSVTRTAWIPPPPSARPEPTCSG